MGVYEDRILPRIVDVALSGKAIDRLRREVCADLHGDVLEVLSWQPSGRRASEHVPVVVQDAVQSEARW